MHACTHAITLHVAEVRLAAAGDVAEEFATEGSRCRRRGRIIIALLASPAFSARHLRRFRPPACTDRLVIQQACDIDLMHKLGNVYRGK